MVVTPLKVALCNRAVSCHCHQTLVWELFWKLPDPLPRPKQRESNGHGCSLLSWFSKRMLTAEGGLGKIMLGTCSKVSCVTCSFLIPADRKLSCWWIRKQWFIVEMALAPRSSQYCVFTVPTMKTKTFSLKLGRTVGLFLVISSACVDEGGGGWRVWLFFLIIFLIFFNYFSFSLAPTDWSVCTAVACSSPRATSSSEQRSEESTSVQACSQDYRGSRNKWMRTGEQQVKLWISLSAQSIVEQSRAWLTLAHLSRRCLSGCSGKNLQSKVLVNYFKVAALFILQR